MEELKLIRKPRVFFDMDGTLNVWETNVHIDEVAAPGYMKKRTPFMHMIDAAYLLERSGFEVWTASAVLPYPHAIPDKDYWLDRYMPILPKERRLYMTYGTNKALTLQKYMRPGDVLVDDYTINLVNVHEDIPGAACVKCLNGINDTHHSWTGARVSVYSDGLSIAASIAGISAMQTFPL